MEPFEIMVSESQERMLCVVEPQRVPEPCSSVCEKWEVLATAIGEVTDTHSFRIFSDGELVGELPVPLLVDDCPLYDLEPEPPTAPLYVGGEQQVATDADPATILKALLASANIASRRAVFEQYDPVVQSRTVRRPEQADAAVLALPVLSAAHRRGRRADPGDRHLDRRQRPPRRGRSARRRRRGRLRVRRQPRLRRRRAARPHQLPELRQPREAARRLAAERGGRRPRAGLPRPRRAGRRRQRLALQRVAGRPDPADAGDRHGRQAPGRAPRRADRVRRPRRQDRAGRRASTRRATAPRLRSCTAARPLAHCLTRTCQRSAPPMRACARACATKRLRERARHRRGRDRGGAGRVLHRRRRRRGRSGCRRASTRSARTSAPRSSCRGPTEALAGLPIIGAVGGHDLIITDLLSVPVSELSAVHADGLSALLS